MGFPNPEEIQAKAHLVFKIEDIIAERCLKLEEAAKTLSISKPELSKLIKGHFRHFTIVHISALLRKLDHDIEIVLHKRLPNTRSAGLRISTSAE